MNSSSPSLSAWTLIADASLVVQFVLLLLLFASILTWAIIFSKLKLVKRSQSTNLEFSEAFWNAHALEDVHSKIADFENSPTARVFKMGYRELRKLPVAEKSSGGQAEVFNIERALNRAHAIEVDHLEKYLDWLATTASAAPFIGLFGTVWGIMNSFQNIGAVGSASLAVVAPGISEALIATAVGLAAAIPAAVGYNYLLNQVRKLSLEIESFNQEFLNMIQRSLLTSKKGAQNGNEQLSK